VRRLYQEFSKQWTARYLEFINSYSDEAVWANDLYRHAIVLELISTDDKQRLNSAKLFGDPCKNIPQFSVKLERDIASYKCNVKRSVALVGEVKKKIESTFDYTDSDLQNAMGAEMPGKYNELHTERSGILNEVINDFNP